MGGVIREITDDVGKNEVGIFMNEASGVTEGRHTGRETLNFFLVTQDVRSAYINDSRSIYVEMEIIVCSHAISLVIVFYENTCAEISIISYKKKYCKNKTHKYI